MRRTLLAMFITCYLTTLCAVIPYSTTPNWSSQDSNNFSTGAIWSDINQDNYPDLVVANGNDMQRQNVVVYLNGANGLSHSINWSSADIDYHGHLDAGDVNNDGFPDLVVSVYIGEQGFSSKGYVKLYINENGTLNPNPVWRSQDSFYTFSCKLVDINLDAKLDLAVSCGESYYNHPDSNRVYLNIGGTFENLPSWKSNRANYSLDVNTADFDHNSFPDLVFVNANQSNQIYFNDNGILSDSAGWNSLDTSNSANSLSLGDINNDSYLDLAVSDNSQIASSGHFKIYQNNQGIMTQEPVWISEFDNYGSGIEFFSNTYNGFDDLMGGGWWTPLYIYQNQNGNFSETGDWVSNTGSVVERIAFADCNRDGEHLASHTFTVNNLYRLLTLPQQHLSTINSLSYNDSLLTLSQYNYDLEMGLIYLAFTPLPESNIEVEYIYSDKLDFAVSNWGNYPNYVFYFDNTISNDENLTPISANLIQMKTYPNPFSYSQDSKITTKIKLPQTSELHLDLFNIKGQKISTIANKQASRGENIIEWTLNQKAKHLSSGVYFLNLRANNQALTQKILVIK